jgi:channel protein (hemolysin III family)
VVWVCALSGVLFKSIFFERIPEFVGLGMFVGLGWFGLVTGLVAAHKFGIRPLLPLLYGGVAYTFGAALDFFRWPVLIDGVLGPHEIFHVFVIVGLGFHWFFIHRYAQDRLEPRLLWQQRRARKAAPGSGEELGGVGGLTEDAGHAA